MRKIIITAVLALLLFYPLVFLYLDGPLFTVRGITIILSVLMNLVLFIVLVYDFLREFFLHHEKTRLEKFFAMILFLFFINLLVFGFSTLKLNYSLMYFLSPLLFFFLVKSDSDRLLKTSIKLLIIVFSYTTILGLMTVQSLEQLLGFTNYRWAGIFSGSDMPNSYYYALFSIGFTLLYELRRNKLWLLGSLLSLVLCFFGQTRGYFYPLLMVSIVYFLGRRYRLNKFFLKLLVTMVLLFVFIRFISETPLLARMASGLEFLTGRDLFSYRVYSDSIYSGETWISRQSMWRYLLQTKVNALTMVVGNGFGTSMLAMGDYFATRGEHPHSDWVSIFIDFGAVGVMAYIFFIYCLLDFALRPIKNHKSFVFMGLFFELTTAISGSNLHLYYQRMIFVFILYIVYASGARLAVEAVPLRFLEPSSVMTAHKRPSC